MSRRKKIQNHRKKGGIRGKDKHKLNGSDIKKWGKTELETVAL
jgi:hypothetical protein